MPLSLITRKNTTLIIILIGGVLFGITMGTFFALTCDLPQIRSIESFKPSATTRIYSSDNILLDELFLEKRDPVPLESIPKHLKFALISTEDRSFYKHSGIDLKGILRAIIKNLISRQYVEGASTITQQLAKTLFLTPEKTLSRKLKEAILSFQLERRYTKDEILGLYLNQVYFGSGAYGIESASRIFFGKSANSLDLAECALIAGMPKAPSRYSPLVSQELALKRRNSVLKQMLITGIITEQEYETAFNEPLLLAGPASNSLKAPYFVEYVSHFLENELENTVGSSQLYKGGLTVHTTLSYEMQQTAETAVLNGLEELDVRMKKNNVLNPSPQCALVSLDVKSGGILAMVGGKNFLLSPYNRATLAKRQPGSAFKPIVYAYAIEKGFAQNMMILDAPVVFRGGANGGDWKPDNFSESYLGEITLRKALALSKNIPSVRLIDRLGASSVAQFAHKLGIESQLSSYLSLSLGTSEVTLLELTAVFAVFANEGMQVKPFCVTEIIDHDGRIIWREKPKQKLVMSRTGAAIITDMLEAVIKEGTGQKAQIINYPVAGKTGTTNEFKDALFIGFSPSITTGVWVGQDNNMPIGPGETGARAALPIWIEFMETVLKNKPYRFFDIPDGVVKKHIDPSSGLIVSDDTPDSVAVLLKAE